MTKAERKSQLSALAAAKGRDKLPKILFAASECAPLAKTGGLADVVGTLPRYLNALGFDARVIIPYHRVIKEKYAAQAEYLFSFSVHMGWRDRFVGVHRLTLDGVCIWLIENEEYFGGPIYLPDKEGEQYAYFTRAVLEALPRLDFIPDILHCNDWHTGMAPLLLKTQYTDTALRDVRTLLTIHNIAYQGLCGFDFVQDYLSIPEGSLGLMERYGMADFLKAGCVMADRVNTVSPSYAAEICTPEYGEGLDGVLRARGGDVGGIVNGIDKTVWNPAKDPLLPANFSRALMAELGLAGDENTPLFGMVTRLAEQKGIGLVLEALDGLMKEGFDLVVLGSGGEKYESALRGAQARHPGRVCAYIGYSEAVAHRVYAGCDFFLMPSLFEPCGISQLIAMRYGALPVVRETGGLKDTVAPYNQFTGEGDGFTFARYDAGDMADAVRRARVVYVDEKALAGLRKNAMAKDFGCDAWAFAYGRLYLDMM